MKIVASVNATFECGRNCSAIRSRRCVSIRSPRLYNAREQREENDTRDDRLLRDVSNRLIVDFDEMR